MGRNMSAEKNLMEKFEKDELLERQFIGI